MEEGGGRESRGLGCGSRAEGAAGCEGGRPRAEENGRLQEQERPGSGPPWGVQREPAL